MGLFARRRCLTSIFNRTRKNLIGILIRSRGRFWASNGVGGVGVSNTGTGGNSDISNSNNSASWNNSNSNRDSSSVVMRRLSELRIKRQLEGLVRRYHCRGGRKPVKLETHSPQLTPWCLHKSQIFFSIVMHVNCFFRFDFHPGLKLLVKCNSVKFA